MKKLVILLSLCLSGCIVRPALPGGGVAEPAPAMASGLPEPPPPGALQQVEPLAAELDPVSEAVAQLTERLQSGLQQNRIQRLPLAVLPFADLDAPAVKGALGERLGESFIYQLEQRGYNLVDYRAVSLATSEKAPLSKGNLSGLRSRYRIYFILTGTYARYPDGLVLNARVLDTTTRQVLASAQSHIPYARLEGALPGYDPLTALQRGMIIENGRGPEGP